jgi:hypothetical protein
MPLTFSSDIHQIPQITDYVDQHDYVLNILEIIDDADINHEDYYDVMADVDAQANSLIESTQPQVYLSEVTLVDDASPSPKIIEPRSYAQVVDSSNIYHKEWQSAIDKELKSLTENNTWTLAWSHAS